MKPLTVFEGFELIVGASLNFCGVSCCDGVRGAGAEARWRRLGAGRVICAWVFL